MNASRRSWFRNIMLVMAAAAPFAASAASPVGDYDDTSYPDVVMQSFQSSGETPDEARRASEGEARVAQATTTAPSPCSCCS